MAPTITLSAITLGLSVTLPAHDLKLIQETYTVSWEMGTILITVL